MLAARAGRCANEQNQFWPYHDYVFGRQGEWSEANDAARQFTEYARRRGWTATRSRSACAREKYQKEVSESFELGTTLGVNGTPTLFVNGKRVQETPGTRAEWDELIRQEQAGAAAGAPPRTPRRRRRRHAAAAPADSAAG